MKGGKVYAFFLLFFLVACSAQSKKEDVPAPDDEQTITAGTDTQVNNNQDSFQIESDYDWSVVDNKNVKEFKENFVKIEEEYGVQWDFCTCVVKNDSINKAFQKEDIPDTEFDRLSERFDVITERCQAFLVQNSSRTPDERTRHREKVLKCLKDAGIQ